LKERFTHGEFDYFLKAEDKDSLEENVLVDKTTKDRFILFWEAITGLKVEVFPCFWN